MSDFCSVLVTRLSQSDWANAISHVPDGIAFHGNWVSLRHSKGWECLTTVFRSDKIFLWLNKKHYFTIRINPFSRRKPQKLPIKPHHHQQKLLSQSLNDYDDFQLSPSPLLVFTFDTPSGAWKHFWEYRKKRVSCKQKRSSAKGSRAELNVGGR